MQTDKNTNSVPGAAGISFLPLFFIIPILINLSLVFWMQNSVDLAGWSAAEITAAALVMILVWKNTSIQIPSAEFLTPMLLVALWAAASLIWSPNIHSTLTGIYKILWILFMLVIFQNDTDAWKKVLEYAVPACSVIAALIIIFFPVSILRVPHPNLYAGFLAMGGIVSTGIMLDSTGKMRVTHFIASGIIAVAIIFLASLGPILSYCAGTALLLSARGVKRSWIAALCAIALFLVAINIGGRSAASISFTSFLQRKLSDPFALERLSIWKDSLKYISRHPITGTGLGTFRDCYPEFKGIEGLRNAPYAHNELINTACELGIVGLSLILWLAWKFLYHVLRAGNSRETADRTYAQSPHWGIAALAALFQSFFDFNLRYPPVLFLSLFFVSCAMPKRNIFPKRVFRACALVLLSLAAILFSLPGVADIIFRSSFQDPVKRRQAALTAARIDPLNGMYWFNTGKMDHAALAVTLEPRNVWYRREAARFLLGEWVKNHDPAYILRAAEQYDTILKLAPNVQAFHAEAESINKLFLNSKAGTKEGGIVKTEH